MKRSEDRILTSHVGALHMPDDLQELLLAEWTGGPAPEGATDARLREAVAEVVRHQAELGIDVVNDGEFAKPTFMGYVTERMSGLETVPARSDLIEREGLMEHSRDFHDFRAFYAEVADQTIVLAPGPETRARRFTAGRETLCTGPVAYTGRDLVQRDIANLKAALAEVDVEEAFLPVIAPGSVQPWIRNEHYPDAESFLGDLAAALRVEYEAIIDAGLICQIDDAFLATEWDWRQLQEGWNLGTYRAWAELSVEALNAAIAGLPEDRIRYHVCWGSWNSPHSNDIPLRDIVDLVLKVNAQTYLLEAANARHEWEFRVWEDVKLPEGKILMPGVIEHATHVVEHPETVAERIIRFANVVGRENVIAGTDCGMRMRSHRDVAWAKLKALSEGAQIATERLWGRR